MHDSTAHGARDVGTRRPRAMLEGALRRLHDEDLGAEAMEYALLGGAGAAACGGLAAFWQSEAFRAFLGSLVTRVGDLLFSFLG